MAGDGKVLSDLAPAISELRHSRRSQPRAPSSFLSNVRVLCVTSIAGSHGAGVTREMKEGSFEVGNQVLIASHRS
jgi:hypothetical protein